MSERALNTQRQRDAGRAPLASGLLQRKCACGNHTIAGGDCEACGKKKETLQRKSANGNFAGEAPAIVHEVLRSPGQPLDAATRAFMEPRFGHQQILPRTHISVSRKAANALSVVSADDSSEKEADRIASDIIRTPDRDASSAASTRDGYDFSRVRIHADSRAADSARSVGALAYTVGNDIVFSKGQYAPATTEGRRLLAHELAHVAQVGQRGSPSQIFRALDPKFCASGDACSKPDALGDGTATAWKLILAVDREQKGGIRLLNANVGHTWIKMQDNAGTKYSYGFWPQTGFDPKHFSKPVEGCVHHPDVAHEPPNATEYSEIGYEISQKHFSNALDYAQSICREKPAYNLLDFNCTKFAIDVTKAAGASPPSSTSLAVHNPNALTKGINEQKGKPEADLVTAGSVFGGIVGGAAIGAAAGGPLGAFIGAGIGAGVGLLGGALFGDLL